MNNQKLKKFIKRCKSSVDYFIESCCKIEHPSIGIIPFNLFNYQKRSLNEFRNNRFNIFLKCRQCFTGDAIVWTPNGPKRIDSIAKGDEIYTYNTNKSSIEIVKVKKLFNNGTRDTVIVRTKTGHKAKVTPDHEYLTQTGWKKAAELTQNDTIIEINDPQRYKSANPSEAILLGYLLTDGYLSSKQVHFTNTRWKYLLEYQKHFELKFGKKLKIKPHNKNDKKSKNAYRIYTYNKDIKKWLADLKILGLKSANKKIPQEIFSWNNNSIAILLNRMFAGDGWYSGSHCNEVGIGSESTEMLHQIKQLLTRFGINSKFYEKTNTSIAKLRIYGGDDYNKFVNYIGINGKQPKKELTKGFFFNRIKGQVLSVKPSEPAQVYDINVPPHNNYIVDGAVVHNSGISTLSSNYALWFGMFYKNKKILIVSKRDRDAIDFLGKIKFAYNNLPAWMREIWKPTTLNEHELGFSNGSIIRSLTSSVDTLRSNASSLNIIDEAAFMQDMRGMWAGGFSCVTLDTLLNIDGQLIEIGELGDIDGNQWQDINCQVQSDINPEKSDKFYINGITNTNKIVTSLGFEIECTDNHKLKNENYDWIASKDIEINQKLAFKCGSNQDSNYLIGLPDFSIKQLNLIEGYKNNDLITAECSISGEKTEIKYRQYKNNYKRNGTFISQKWATIIDFSDKFIAPIELDHKLAEMLGYYVGDGCISENRPKRFRLCYDPQDSHLYDHFASYFNKIGLKTYQHNANGAKELRINNARFIEWLKLNKLNSKTNAYDAEVPQSILKSPKQVRAAFLRGLFEADGWCHKSKNSNRPNSDKVNLGLSSVSKKLIKQVQLMLLDLGIISKTIKTKGGYKNSCTSYRLEIINLDNMINFMNHIGFISDRKNINIEKYTNYEPSKYHIDENGIFYDKVVTITRNKKMTVDISVPSNNTYIANGFVSHNTMQHGGSCIVISTPFGIGNWYHEQWSEAEMGTGIFNPIKINWWDMDWALEFIDPLTNEYKRIAPTDNIRKCKTKKEIEKYGPYWSPWLENEYKGLKSKGESHLFRQEILAEFIGSGGTVLSNATLLNMQNMIEKSRNPKTIIEPVLWVNSNNGDRSYINLSGDEKNEGIHIWSEPIKPKGNKLLNNQIVEKAKPGHNYVGGVDIATGENQDYSTVQIFDINTMEQVAEYMGRPKPDEFAAIVDWLGRWYNNALLNVERTGIGITVVQKLQQLLYPNLWRKKDAYGVKSSKIGFATTAQSKPTLDKALITYLSEDEDEGYTIHSMRLLQQLQIYIRKRNRQGMDTKKTGAQEGRGNHDDLVISTALAFTAVPDVIDLDPNGLLPVKRGNDIKTSMEPVNIDDIVKKEKSILKNNTDNRVIIPLTGSQMTDIKSINEELKNFEKQIMYSPLHNNNATTNKKHQL